MKNIREFYILGLPVETAAGVIRPLTVVDYAEYVQDLYTISLSKNYIIYKYMESNKDHELDDFIEELKKVKLMDLVMGLPELQQSYMRIFEKSFQDDSYIRLINEDNFDEIRDVLMKVNCIKEEDAYLNPEIQRAVERSKRVKSMESDGTDFGDILSSIVAYTGIDYSIVKGWTLYQVYATYSRINQFQNYDSSVLFSTVAEKVDIQSWSKHIDLFEKEDHAMSMSDFKNKYGKMMG